MNRQQRRAQAKAQAKANTGIPRLKPLPQGHTLMGLGAFYKGDTNNGMGLTITFDEINKMAEQTGLGLSLDSMYDHICQDANAMLEVYANSNTKPQDRQTLWQQLQEAVADFNTAAYGTPTQPARGFYQLLVNPVNTVNEFVRAATYIAVLVCIGEIQDDNQNGLNLMYMAK